MNLALALLVASTLTQETPNRPVAVEFGLGLLGGGLGGPVPYAGGIGGPAVQFGVAAISEAARPLTFFGRADATLFMNATGGWFSSGAIHAGARLNLDQVFFVEAGVGGTTFLLPAAFISTGIPLSMLAYGGEVGVGARGGNRLQHTCAVRMVGGPVAGGGSWYAFSLGLACSLSWPEPAR